MEAINQYKINIYNEVNGVAAVSSTDGKNIYEKIKTALNSHKLVVLDFINIKFVTSAFFNTAVGTLYKDFDENTISEIQIENMPDNDKVLYNQVLNRAKDFYCNPDYQTRLIESLKEEMSENDNN